MTTRDLVIQVDELLEQWREYSLLYVTVAENGHLHVLPPSINEGGLLFARDAPREELLEKATTLRAIYNIALQITNSVMTWREKFILATKIYFRLQSTIIYEKERCRRMQSRGWWFGVAKRCCDFAERLGGKPWRVRVARLLVAPRHPAFIWLL